MMDILHRRKSNRLKSDELRFKIEPELRRRLEVIAQEQKRSVPSVAYWLLWRAVQKPEAAA